MIKLIVADCDGTILNSKKEIDSDLLDVVRILRSKGIEFTLASGRNRYLMRDVSKDLEVTYPYIANNGANIYQNDEPVEMFSMELDIVNKMTQMLVDNGTPFIIYGENDIYRHGRHRLLDGFAKKLENLVVTHEFEVGSQLKDIDIFKITVATDDVDDVKEVQDEINTVYPSVFFKRSEGTLFTITSSHATKGQALIRLLKRLNLTKDEVMVFGDNYNDVTMFDEAVVSVSMKESAEDIKKISTHVAGSNEENGVSSFLKTYFKLD